MTSQGGGTKANEDTGLLIRRRDADLLDEIAMRGLLSAPRAAGALLDALRRAEIRPDDQVPADVVGLGAWVTFIRGDASTTTRPEQVRLVTPAEADPLRGRLSVLNSLGAGLIGLRAGQSVDWPDRLGGIDRLAVLAVKWPAAGGSRKRPTKPASSKLRCVEKETPMNTSDEERRRATPGDEDQRRRSEPEGDDTPSPKVVRLPSQRSVKRAFEDDWPPGAA
ncbi:GreA/GreB family elongation factor [Phenylobacterium sp. LjRoot219]|uniref:GreA/GreB family elongation factor n=1 Tax=Phenylobacterium sp. LjRoot219 TaxID=3342283 RepID=UPI003ED153DB